MRRLFWIVAAMVTGGLAVAQAPQKVAEIYTTTVFAVAGDNEQQTLEPVPAKLIVRPAELNNGATSVTLEIDTTTAPVTMYRVPRHSLPAEVEAVMGGQGDLWLDATRYHSGRSPTYDLSPGSSDGGRTKSHTVTVYDATGAPAAGVQVDVVAGSNSNPKKTLLSSVTLGPDGTLIVPMPYAPNRPEQMNGMHLHEQRISLLATDPSGQRQEVVFPSSDLEVPPKPVWDTAYLAFVPRDADHVAFRGQVVDENAMAVAGARLSLYWLEFPGRGGKQFNVQTPTVSTAPDGTFSIGVPKNFLLSELGVHDLPSSSVLQVRLNGLGTIRLHPDRNNTLVLAYKEKVQFQLFNADGSPVALEPGTPRFDLRLMADGVTDRDRGEYMSVSARVTDPENGIIALGEITLPGTYSIKVWDRVYQAKRLEKGAGQSIIPLVISSDHATVKGRVLSAEDGVPIAGAYVIGSNDQGTPHRLVKLAADELESIWNAKANGTAEGVSSVDDDVKLRNGDTIFSVHALAKSDSTGSFVLNYPAGKAPTNIHVYTPGRMGATASLYHLKKPDLASSETVLPDVSLPLSAAVQVVTNAPEKVPDQFLRGEADGNDVTRNSLMAGVGFERPGPWTSAVPPLNGSETNPWTLITTTDWLSAGNHVILQVPANLKFSVTVSASYKPTLGTASWKDQGPLQPGEFLELPPKTISVRTPFLIRVKNKDGTPVVGMSVRIDGHLPLTTDQDGTVIGWSSGHVGRIEVMPDNSWEIAAEARDIEIPQTTDLKEVDLVLK